MIFSKSNLVIIFFFISKYLIMLHTNGRAIIRTFEESKELYLKLIEKIFINHDTRIFRIALPSENHVLGLPIGQHIAIVAQINGDTISRKYTPISSDDDKGIMDLIIKVYFKDVHPEYPKGGKMTQYLESLNIGDQMLIKGPKGKITYKEYGTLIKNIPKLQMIGPIQNGTYKMFGMIAGGSGIAPILQITRHILKDPNDPTKIWLLFANKKEEDILLRDELDQLEKEYPDRFRIWYTLDKAPSNWKYSTGYINAEMIAEFFPSPSDDIAMLHCGPKLMNKIAVVPNLEKLGYSSKHVYKI
uniref:NADH-cytochrome b5 reductase n=1 Tax=Acrobeloides nanus TaxID=290746 RepID=A0A914EB15_9BILA